MSYVPSVHPAGGLFDTPAPVRKPLSLHVYVERPPLRLLPFAYPSLPGGTLWLTCYGHPLQPGDYVCHPWSVLSHAPNRHCTVYAVRDPSYREVTFSSKAQVEADQPTIFAFAPVRAVTTRHFGAGLLFSTRIPEDLSLNRPSPALTSLMGDDTRAAGIQLKFANDAFALYNVGATATLITVTQLQPRTLTALTAL